MSQKQKISRTNKLIMLVLKKVNEIGKPLADPIKNEKAYYKKLNGKLF